MPELAALRSDAHAQLLRRPGPARRESQLSTPVNWGILSTARVDRRFLAGTRDATDALIVAVASCDGATAERYAREQRIERAHAGYLDLLADPDVDIVHISVPNSLHLEWTVRALEAGKHVLCEPPLGPDAADVSTAFDIAERKGGLLMEAFTFRHNPQTQRVIELIAEERLVGCGA